MPLAADAPVRPANLDRHDETLPPQLTALTLNLAPSGEDSGPAWLVQVQTVALIEPAQLREWSCGHINRIEHVFDCRIAA